MATRGNDQAQQASKSANAISNTNAGEASGIFGTLNPFLTAEMVHPPGFDPATLAGMNTGAQQSAGGAAAGAVGQGALRAARTRNRGGSDAATGASVRSAGETLSKGLLGVQSANARLKEQQREGATEGLGKMFSTTTGAGIGALGEVAPNVNASTNAENASWNWARDLFVPLATAAMKGARPGP